MRPARGFYAVVVRPAERQRSWATLNRIDGHIVGIVFRLPSSFISGIDGITHLSLSIGRYCNH
ncbi:hypothetical protein SEA_EASTWEST_6 [Arthrobacter phage EastWest]|uniref:Uncharacterized protein n=1 Tax=Arthrobacter phage EastWest TaxID=2894292 RepID=A0AAE9C8S6_9CAUD|nr:hypothetical protein SEA_EASTWEST_6 [Arthrobacter phage EastWest]